MRVDREGNQWTHSYKLPDSAWVSAGSFAQVLEVASTGIFAGNRPDNGTAPAFTVQADYVMNTSFRIDPEDGASGSVLSIETTGQGLVQQDPPPNEQNRYNCGQVVTLTAVPKASEGWKFGGWSGDLSGLSNPTTIVMDRNRYVTASFTQGQEEILAYLPSVIRP
jgi:hypothetical protein